MSQFHFTPTSYLELMRDAIPVYDEFEQAIADATRGIRVARILDLGTGTGETAQRVLALHPAAVLTGVDASAEMLELARATLPGERVERLGVGDIGRDLPPGAYELVIAGLSIHHLDTAGKAALFERVAGVLSHGGRFVIGDVIVPEHDSDAVTPISPAHDYPERLDSLVAALAFVGLSATVVWAWRDLVVIAADQMRVQSTCGPSRQPAMWSLRPVTEADREFLYELNRETMRDHVEAVWGWDEAFQRRHFDEHFRLDSQIVMVGVETVGMLLAVDRTEDVCLASIRIAPGWQQRGIGTDLIRSVLVRAADSGKPVWLRVLKVNARATALYERLGFVVTDETDTHFKMTAATRQP